MGRIDSRPRLVLGRGAEFIIPFSGNPSTLPQPSLTPVADSTSMLRVLHRPCQNTSKYFLRSPSTISPIFSVTMANKAAFLETEKGVFAVRDTEIGQPSDKEVLIKVTSVVELVS